MPQTPLVLQITVCLNAPPPLIMHNPFCLTPSPPGPENHLLSTLHHLWTATYYTVACKKITSLWFGHLSKIPLRIIEWPGRARQVGNKTVGALHIIGSRHPVPFQCIKERLNGVQKYLLFHQDGIYLSKRGGTNRVLRGLAGLLQPQENPVLPGCFI